MSVANLPKPTVPEVGVFLRSRPRPTYAIPLRAERLTKSYYPKSNSRRIGPNATVHWKLTAWRKVEGGFEGSRLVQTRLALGAAFEDHTLACCFTAVQTRNGGDEGLSGEDYLFTCDAESQELCHHSESVLEALDCYYCRDWIAPGESFTELAALFVPSEFKHRKLWAPALLTVIERLAALSPYQHHVCILKASPLEDVWRRNALQRASWNGEEPPSEERLERENYLAARRVAALQALYARELGFEALDEHWMARLVEPTDQRR